MTEASSYFITLLVGTASLILLLLEIRANHVWNQKRTSYELMNEMITSGRMTGALERLKSDFGFDIVGGTTPYSEIVGGLGATAGEKVKALDADLVVILRHLEMLSISMQHGIVSERIARDGFVAFFARILENGRGFIDKERERRANPHVYERFEHYALKWGGDRPSG